MNNDKLMAKIRKIAALAESAVNENEAMAATVILQKLMAENDLDMADIVDVAPQSAEDIAVDTMGTKQAWRASLALIIAKNFRCEVYWSGYQGHQNLKMVGMTNDLALAKQAYDTTLKAINKFHKKHVNARKAADYAAGYPQWTISQGHHARASYIDGFLMGLSEAFRNQVKSEGLAGTEIVLVKPEAVVKAYSQLNLKSATRSNANTYGDWTARAAGAADGSSYGSGKALEA